MDIIQIHSILKLSGYYLDIIRIVWTYGHCFYISKSNIYSLKSSQKAAISRLFMKGKSQPCQLKKMKLMKCHVRSLSSKKNLILCLCNNKWCIKVNRYVFISILMIGLKSKSIKTLTLIRLMSGCLIRLGGGIRSHQHLSWLRSQF